MMHPEDPPPPAEMPLLDPTFEQEVDRLHDFTVRVRWLVIGSLWLTVGSASLWGLRYPIGLMIDHFTWVALRYGLIFHPLSAIGLMLCVGLTVAVLVWQSRNILFGLPRRDRQSLEKQVCRIRQQGNSHPLWQFVCSSIEK